MSDSGASVTLIFYKVGNEYVTPAMPCAPCIVPRALCPVPCAPCRDAPFARPYFSPSWWREPALNLLAAAAQFSSYTHVEVSLGEAHGSFGQMANVVRIYNDAVGVEVCERTGRNPQVCKTACTRWQKKQPRSDSHALTATL
jgi:hypothetical protein